MTDKESRNERLYRPYEMIPIDADLSYWRREGKGVEDAERWRVGQEVASSPSLIVLEASSAVCLSHDLSPDRSGRRVGEFELLLLSWHRISFHLGTHRPGHLIAVMSRTPLSLSTSCVTTIHHPPCHERCLRPLSKRPHRQSHATHHLGAFSAKGMRKQKLQSRLPGNERA